MMFFTDFVKKPDFLHHKLLFCFQLRKISKEAPGAKKTVESLVIIRNAHMLNTVNAFIEKRISLKGSEWPKPRT